ncbi:MAG: molybdenum cofactor biosynthesis protein MoaE [Elusimicrobia bacterium]|nr:molybdenum cofactor biosynthesis protein MoaE [Elusimicrobiota bacterium]
MKSLSSRRLAAVKSVFITRNPLSIKKAIRHFSNPKHGAIALFCGVVRNKENGVEIRAITYEAYLKMAEKEIFKIVEIARKKWDVTIKVFHRLGKILVGENSLIVVCSGKHRQETFKASQFVIHQIKSKVPIWKVKFHKKNG